MGRMTAADAGNLLFDVWMDAGDDGLSPKDTLAATELTDKQFRNGKDYLRRVLTLDNQEPFSYDPVDNVYRMNTSQARVQEYAVRTMKGAVRRLLRLHSGTVLPQSKKAPTRPHKRLTRHLQGLIEDLIDLLEGNGVDVAEYEQEFKEAIST